MKSRIHAFAGVMALLVIAIFWTSTLITEAFLSYTAVAKVKTGILYSMLLLVPALMVTAGSGFSLAGRRREPLLAAKKQRMPFVAVNGLLILLPAAFFLQSRAVAGNFDTWFYIAQAVELLAGGSNLALMGMNLRDGLRLRRTA